MDTKELKQSLDNISNALLSINNTLLNLNTLMMNTETKGNAQKPLKTAINDSLFLNTPNKIDNKSSRDDLFDLSNIEYYEGSIVTVKELSDVINIKNLPLNVFSREFKKLPFYKDHTIIPYRSLKNRGFRNIRLRLDTSNDQR